MMKKIATLLLVLLMIGSLFGVTVTAIDSTPESTPAEDLTVGYTNESLSDDAYGPTSTSAEEPVDITGTEAITVEIPRDEVREEDPKDPYVLGFMAGNFTPTQRIDLKIQEKAQEVSNATASVNSEQYTYCFVMISGKITDAKLTALADLEVKLLGYHPHHCYKAKIPLNRIEELEGLPFIRWIGYAPSDLKIHPALKQDMSTRSAGDEILVYISVFDSDLNEESQKIVQDGEKQYYTYKTNGPFQNKLEEMGVTVLAYDEGLMTFTARAAPDTINEIVNLDFVLFVEPEPMKNLMHDQSTPDVGADYIRPPSTSYDGTGVYTGIIDSGVETAHWDIDPPSAIGWSWVGGSPFDDPCGHGTHVAGTVMGNGDANAAYRGMADDSDLQSCRIFYWTGTGWTWGDSDGNGQDDCIDAMNWLAITPQADIVHGSIGVTWSGCWPSPGTDAWSRKADEKVNDGQIYVFSAGNKGDDCGDYSIGAPGCAKNVFTVGAVLDYGYTTVDDITSYSSLGPTGDNRFKPDVVAPGKWVTSCDAFDLDDYVTYSGTSMSAPHVTGAVSTFLEHYPTTFKGHADRVKAQFMSSALLHHGTLGSNPVNTYGLGKIDNYRTHYSTSDWTGGWFYGSVSSSTWQYSDLTIPSGTDRLVLVLTWIEPPASAGASYAVLNDLDLTLDKYPFSSGGNTGEWFSWSSVNNVEYIIVENPAADTYRVKVYPYDITTGGSQPYVVSYGIIKGDPTPTINMNTYSSKTYVKPNEVFTLSTDVSASDYIASGVAAKLMSSLPSGVTIQSMKITREDGTTITYGAGSSELTLGDIVQVKGDRTLKWDLKSSTEGTKTIWTYATSDNAGSDSDYKTVYVDGTPPLASISINSGATYTDTTSVTLSLTYSDSGSGVDKCRYKNSGGSWTSWQTCTPTKSWTLSTGDGYKYVYYEVKDKAGNVKQVNDYIYLDTTDPSASISINSGATYTTTTSVTLSLTYSDSGSGVDKCRYKNSGGSWTSWQTCTPTKSWTLTTGDGTKTVYYQVRDRAGNIRQVYDSIVLDTTKPSVTVNSPNGGEIWEVGTMHDITWTATDNVGVTSIDILISTNGGTNYHTIATGEPNDGTYPWTITDPPSTTCRVKVVAHDAAGNTGEDASDANFEIRRVDTEPPSVTVNSPNGGEVWDVGTTHDITWTATDNVGVTSIDIKYSTDGGSSYPDMIATGEPNDGTYPWTITDPPSTTCRVKVVAHDAAGNTGEDASDANFEIREPTFENKVYFVPQESEAPYCSEKEVEIWVNATNFKSGQINMTYDPTCANVTNYAWNATNFPTSGWSHYDGMDQMTFMTSQPSLTGKYHIGTLTIHCVNDNSEGCITPLDFIEEPTRYIEESELYDPSGAVIPANWIDGSFKCRPGICGDVNRVGGVNMGDVGALHNYVQYGYPIADEWAADVNCAGGINMGDVGALHNHVQYGYPLNCC